MATEVTMPKLGLTMEQGTVLSWKKKVGEPVGEGEVLLLIQTDKVEFEVESPVGGTVLKLVANEGDVVPTGDLVAYIGEAEEQLEVGSDLRIDSEAPSDTPLVPGETFESDSGVLNSPPVSPVAKNLAVELGVDLSIVKGSGMGGRIVKEDILKLADVSSDSAVTSEGKRVRVLPGCTSERVFISPLARRFARERGIDYKQIRGSGPNGRIIKQDILKIDQKPDATPGIHGSSGEVLDTIPVRGMRQIIKERMKQSWSTIPHVTEVIDVDVTKIVELRQEHKATWEKQYGARVSYNDIFVFQVARAIHEFPRVNSRLNGDVIEILGEVNIGVAVELEEGLMVPVVRNADQKNVGQISREVQELAERARQGQINPDELTGSTFTISNLGGYGIQLFTPIIDHPNSCILGIGKITKTPVVIENAIAIRDIVYLSLSFDHRIIDGAPAAQFLALLKEMMEAPAVALM